MDQGCRRFGALLLLACAPLLLAAAPPSNDDDPEAWHAAQTWLALIDAREYQESWNEASRSFQGAVTARAWAQQAAALRQQSGDPISRELVDTHPVTDPPDLPPGEYLRIRYECECSAAGVVRESLMLVREAGRGWRVARYVVQLPAGG
jgi:hypothetical protein